MKEALKLALEALEVAKQHIWLGDKAGVDANIKAHQTITAIKEALAQPKQEPVAWESILGAIARGWCYEKNANKTIDKDLAEAIAKEVYALYTTPPQRKPLTDEEIMNIAKVSCIGISPHEDTLNFAKVIEAVHGIKE